MLIRPPHESLHRHRLRGHPTVRVGLSIALLLFIWFSYWMGWIEPRSY
ncbi:MAG: DUF2909 domain-containing protein [Burkholderiaceae bacterium]|nr:DUF2909 domain-containing protein [Burkholderiaceae bacterium]